MIISCGWNRCGQLGIGNKLERFVPTSVPRLIGSPVVAIACGGNHSAAVLETGEIFTWGWNCHGQLGLGDTTDRTEPKQVMALAGMRIVTVVCGEDHTVAIDDHGELFIWGHDGTGQSRHDDDHCTPRTTPCRMEALHGRPVVAAACGGHHTLVLLKHGEVFAWGRGGAGQLGLGDFHTDPVVTPQQVHFFDDRWVTSVHAKGNVSGAVLGSGRVYMWGDNEHWQLGAGDQVNRATPTLVIADLTRTHVSSLAIGDYHTIALGTKRLPSFADLISDTTS